MNYKEEMQKLNKQIELEENSGKIVAVYTINTKAYAQMTQAALEAAGATDYGTTSVLKISSVCILKISLSLSPKRSSSKMGKIL